MKKLSLASAKYFIGTSGWVYKDWAKKFYPKNIKDADKLSYYAEHFPSVEINNSFYRLPSERAYENWYTATPASFTFSVKLSRYLTHIKRLKLDDETAQGIDIFCSRASLLKDKLGAILVQLPPSFRASEERVVNLTHHFKKAQNRYKRQFNIALECRHASWFTDKYFNLLESLNIACVINSSPAQWPANCRLTAELAYFRWHGSKKLYTSSYSDKELQKWASFIKENIPNSQAVYGYFNNDKSAKAVENAKTLTRLLS